MSVDPENPVLQWPLAFCDAQSVPADDLLDNFLKKKGEDENEWSGHGKTRTETCTNVQSSNTMQCILEFFHRHIVRSIVQLEASLVSNPEINSITDNLRLVMLRAG